MAMVTRFTSCIRASRCRCSHAKEKRYERLSSQALRGPRVRRISATAVRNTKFHRIARVGIAPPLRLPGRAEAEGDDEALAEEQALGAAFSEIVSRVLVRSGGARRGS
jgi:hypothetical protein